MELKPALTCTFQPHDNSIPLKENINTSNKLFKWSQTSLDFKIRQLRCC